MIQFTRKLRAILERAGKLDAEKADALVTTARQDKRPFSEVLVKNGVVTEAELLALIGAAANVPPINLERVQVNPDVLGDVPVEVARQFKIFPIDKIGSILTVAVANPFDVLKLDDVRIRTGCDLRPVVSTEEAIERRIEQAYKSEQESLSDMMNELGEAGDIELKEQDNNDEGMDLAAINDEASPVVKIVNKLVADACTSGVSDIHIEPFEKKVIVRYRRDGCLVEVMQLPKGMQNNLTSRIKIMSKLDIAEKQRPQDGKFQMKLGRKAIDFRVSILPVVWGEKTVMRILDSSNLALDIKSLGFESKSMEDYLWAVERPYGMILVTGPTGSGKSTTLYSAVNHIKDPEINLVTVEDPVEYTIEGINQVPVNPKRGLTFAGALRSILRQDPDVVLLGEIRDAETLEIAVKAALTGHLVLSTLHTNDAVATISRMVDMGMDPFMVASSTILICAQRLARKLCVHCKVPAELPKQAYLDAGCTEAELARPENQLFKPVGCSRCSNGYKGRFAILETLRMTDPIRRMVIERRPGQDIKALALSEGMLTLRRCGLLNVMRGVTSLEEVERSTMAD
ncbi:MAG: Flp pilus assembly complex ATPase component TadA [Planctomycetes bacterium]|nr:Flp pilus assembly complex ATPase component TadA [Planctomycetota bacterium]